ncbi:unnamed protein product [Closterium sp. NIES-54]
MVTPCVAALSKWAWRRSRHRGQEEEADEEGEWRFRAPLKWAWRRSRHHDQEEEVDEGGEWGSGVWRGGDFVEEGGPVMGE